MATSFAQELTAASAATMQATRTAVVDEVVAGFREACIQRAEQAASSAASTKTFTFDDFGGAAKRNGFVHADFRARLQSGLTHQLSKLGLSEYKVHLCGQRLCTGHYTDCPIEDPRICRAKIKVSGSWPCVWDMGLAEHMSIADTAICGDGNKRSSLHSFEGHEKLADFLLVSPIDLMVDGGNESERISYPSPEQVKTSPAEAWVCS